VKKVFKILGWLVVFLLLTVLTQIGGVVLLLSFLIVKQLKFKGKLLVSFTAIYLVSTFFVVPIIASMFGREKVNHTDKIKPTTYLTVLLNRNYVRHELNVLLSEAENNLKGSDIEIRYLDANFPFINKFPLLPHLSHNDGKKIDLSLVYENHKGNITNLKKSRSGYGVFEEPKSNEFNQTKECLEKGYFQYDYPKYLTLGSINKDLRFSKKGTKKLLKAVLKSKRLGKLFIESHLKERLNLRDSRVRFQGCRAVRHDDHIHIQLK